MNGSDIWNLDATAQAELVRRGETTPRELVDLSLARIAQLNPHVNAVITVLEEEARRQVKDGSLGGQPFHGVPILLKDAVQEVAGTPYALGTPVLRAMGWRSRQTTEFAQRLRRAGFICIGKTNVPELSSGTTTEPEAFGATRNPWDLSRTAGGSSGGSAVAVAVGMTPVAHGGDATGSLRVPASACGVVTLKPSRGMVPHATPADMPDPLHVWCDFVLARSIRDLAGILDAVRNPGSASPLSLSGGLTQARPETSPLRVGLLVHDPFLPTPVHPACVEGVERAGKVLHELGYDVEYSYPAAFDGLFTALSSEFAVIGGFVRAAQQRWLASVVGRELRAGDVSDEFLQTATRGEAVSRARFDAAIARVRAAMEPIREWWLTGHDLLVTPTLRQPPWPLGSPDNALQGGLFNFPASFTGQPAVSLPLHCTEAGLPVGVQIVGDVGTDALLLAVAAQLEEACSWRNTWPSLAGAPAPICF